MMTIERTNTEIIIRLSPELKIEELQRFLNYLKFKEIAQKSKAKPTDALDLAKEVNKSWWEKNKGKYLPEE